MLYIFTDLQSLINTAVDYVDKHGLRFNATKTNCFINGTNPFIIKPKLFISDIKLCIKENIDYLGATLGNKCNKVHVNSRVRACRTAFHALQGAGLCNRGLTIETSMYVWSVACKSVLTYACHSTYLNNENIKDL